jgi:hypothetical protein
MTDINVKLDVQSPSSAITEIAKGRSELRDALQAMSELAERGCSTAELAPYLRQAWSGAAAMSMVCALVGAMECAGETWPSAPQH